MWARNLGADRKDIRKSVIQEQTPGPQKTIRLDGEVVNIQKLAEKSEKKVGKFNQ